ncbi:MAG: sigma 54-interacting transcriptional regulator [Pirellulaceae bacterium]|nr:sigma 54-interacting transcriptional regulator [Pirellulaceae bacterium]
MVAYLVIREGNSWTDVFRLVPGRTTSMGRATTNQIVVKDDRCSRYHAEIFFTDNHWTLRDLGSRNGTIVKGTPLESDHLLLEGDVIQIADFQMLFSYNLEEALSSGPARAKTAETFSGEETVIAKVDADTNTFDWEQPKITHRRDKTKFLSGKQDKGSLTQPKFSQAASTLCRLAFDLGQKQDIYTISQTALSGILENIKADAGAVLLLSFAQQQEPPSEKFLEIAASFSHHKKPYQKITPFLAQTVLKEGEAILARNISDDETLAAQDSRGEIHATSVICTPIRQGEQILGLIHLYFTDSNRVPDPDDLEFTLAVADNVALALKNLYGQRKLEENLLQTQDEIQELRQRLGTDSNLVGRSLQLQRVQQEIARAAPSKATIFIRGESGVGKELVARAVHFASPQKSGPFICLNCAALSETLLESELFGHERGAFTGATERKIGKFEAAHEGTLMLDEIGEMSPTLQAKFLRVLEGHPFERLGGNEAIFADVRVIAATNRDLEQAIQKNLFRQDLYFRLKVIEILVPPLRDRKDDIVELANHFLQRFNLEAGRKIKGFTPEALKHLQVYQWPGNIRELKNVVERAVVLTPFEYIQPNDLPLADLSQPSLASSPNHRTPADSLSLDEDDHTNGKISSPPPRSLAEVEKEHILATLRATSGNKSQAASILGIERSTLDRKLKRYGVSTPRIIKE